MGITSRRKRTFIGVRTIALLAGPTSAVMMIPVYRNGWFGGGADIILPGTTDQLWPSNMTSTGIKVGNDCVVSGLESADLSSLGIDGCIWLKLVTMVQTLTQWIYNPEKMNITLQDGVFTRDIDIWVDHKIVTPKINTTSETWAIAPKLSPLVYSLSLEQFWVQAVDTAPLAKGLGKQQITNGETRHILHTVCKVTYSSFARAALLMNLNDFIFRDPYSQGKFRFPPFSI